MNNLLRFINSKKAFILFLSILFIFGLLLVNDYGISGDEQTQVVYGNYVWDYMKNFGNPVTPFETIYKGEMLNMKYYGGLFDGVLSMFIDIFNIQNKFFFRHVVIFIFGITGLVYIGLLAKKISKSWGIGILAVLFVVFTPRFFGEIFNNPKDIPFATGYAAAIYYLLLIIQNIKNSIKSHYILLGLWIGFTMSVRIGGLLLVAYTLLFVFIAVLINKLSVGQIKKVLIYCIFSLVLGYILLISWWPYAHDNLFSAPFDALSLFSKFPVKLFILHDGMRINTEDIPNNYLFTWISIAQPILIIIGLFGFIILTILRKQDLLSKFLIAFATFFPIAYIVIKHSIVHDGLRHILFTLPFMALLTALFIHDLMGYFNKDSKIKYFIPVLSLILLFHPIRHTFANHPNQYVYFNETFGGIENAVGYYELDYYCNSGKKANEWLRANVYDKIPAGQMLKVGSNIGTYHLYDEGIIDSNKVQNKYVRWRERDQVDWDYYVAYSRFLEPEYLQAGHFPPGHVVYEVKVDGVPVTAIIKRTNKDDLAAAQALKHNDFPTAATLYQQSLAIDSTNEYTWVQYGMALANSGKPLEGASAIARAIQINSSNVEWMKMLANLYQQLGDPASANKYKTMAASKIAEQ